MWWTHKGLWTISSGTNFGCIKTGWWFGVPRQGKLIDSFFRTTVPYSITNLPQVKDSIEPIVATRAEASLWSKLTFRYWFDKIKIDGFTANDNVRSGTVLKSTQIEKDSSPEVICKHFIDFFAQHDFYSSYFLFLADITDMLGDQMHFCLQFSNGIFFATADEVEDKWCEFAVNYMENNLVTNWFLQSFSTFHLLYDYI